MNGNAIDILLRARVPIIFLQTHEEQRALSVVREVASGLNKEIMTWSFTEGYGGDTRQCEGNPAGALDYIWTEDTHAQIIYCLLDFHPFMKDVQVVRKLRDVARDLPAGKKSIIIISSQLVIPPELEKELTVVDLPLPDSKMIDTIVDQVLESTRGKVDLKFNTDQREQIVQACMGLTCLEVENTLSKSLIETRTLDVDSILSEKEAIIKKSGMLEYTHTCEDMAEVGGLEVLKAWLTSRGQAFSAEAKAYGLDAPKGILLLGVPGTGKSLISKAIAKAWHRPLLKWDMSRILGGIVGESEHHMASACKVAESTAPNIVFIDEFEKAFSGSKSSGELDSGVSMRLTGSFLSWMEDRTAAVFVVATCNDITALPPELTRAGRWDAVIFIDLPNFQERIEIFAIHLRKRRRDASIFDIKSFAEATNSYSGAEIEQIVKNALYEGFSEGREITNEDIMTNIKKVVPLSTTMKEKIDSLRAWAKGRCIMASKPEEKKEAGGRDLEL